MNFNIARINGNLLDFIAVEVVGSDFDGLFAVGGFSLSKSSRAGGDQSKENMTGILSKKIYQLSRLGAKIDLTLV